MSNDRESAQRSFDFQSRACEFRMVDLPNYIAWSTRKMAEGESESLIAHLDATAAWLPLADAARMTDKDYDEMLAELKEAL